MKSLFVAKSSLLAFLAVVAFGCSHGQSQETGRNQQGMRHGMHQGAQGMQGMHRMTMTAEQHQMMAEMHQKVAECLQEGKTQRDCMKVMRENCPLADKGYQCPMMSGMMGATPQKGQENTSDN